MQNGISYKLILSCDLSFMTFLQQQSPKVITADSRKISVSFRDDVTVAVNGNGRKSLASEDSSLTSGNSTTGGGILKNNGNKLTEDTGNGIKEE